MAGYLAYIQILDGGMGGGRPDQGLPQPPLYPSTGPGFPTNPIAPGGMPPYPSTGPGFPTNPIAPGGGGQPPYPSQGLPPFPSQGLPPGGPYPDQGLPGGSGGQPSHPWVPPTDEVPEHPIVLPPGQTPPVYPAHPIEGVTFGYALIFVPGMGYRWVAFPVEPAQPPSGGQPPQPDQGLPPTAQPKE